jgi:hypothetical protein
MLMTHRRDPSAEALLDERCEYKGTSKTRTRTEGGRTGIITRRMTKAEDVNETRASANVGSRGIMMRLGIR